VPSYVPNATIRNSWSLTGATVAHEAVDKSADAVSYVSTSTPGVPVEVGLPAVTDPLVSRGHVINVEHATSGGTGTFLMELLEYGRRIYAAQVVSTNTDTATAIPIPHPAVSTIRNYSGLQLRAISNGPPAGFEQRISYMGLDAPAAASFANQRLSLYPCP